jgi:hypothetical protein
MISIYKKMYFRDDAFFFVFFRLGTLGSIITKQGFGAIFGVFSTKCFKFYLYLPITRVKIKLLEREIYMLHNPWGKYSGLCSGVGGHPRP